MSTPTVTVGCLVEAGTAALAETTIYTSPAGTRTIIDKVTSYAAASPATLTLKVVPSGGSAGASNVLGVKTFSAGESYTWPELVGHILEPGDAISEIATGTVVRRLSGRSVR